MNFYVAIFCNDDIIIVKYAQKGRFACQSILADQSGMNKKILFTGNGTAVIDDLMAHLPEVYQKNKCLPLEHKLFQALERYEPDAIVIGVHAETRESLYLYSLLKGHRSYDHIPMIVIGGEEDCGLFRKNVFQKNLEIFVRPLDMEIFIKKLDELIEVSQQHSQNVQEKSEERNKPEVQREAKEQENPEVQKKGSVQELESQLLSQIERMNREYGRKSVLVVDDDVRMLSAIKLYLEGLYDVAMVPSGKLALKYLEKKKADMVILDYMMPDMDGSEVLRQIRQSSRFPHIPVIFLTGVSEREKVIKGLEFRPSGYMLKPVDPFALLEKVTEVILGLQ